MPESQRQSSSLDEIIDRRAAFLTDYQNAAYAGQVVHFPDPVRASRHPRGVRVDEDGFPDFLPYARASSTLPSYL